MDKFIDFKLKKNLNNIKNSKDKLNYLTNLVICIIKKNPETYNKLKIIYKLTEESPEDNKIEISKELFCKICNSNEFISDKYSNTCKLCGAEGPSELKKGFSKINIEYLDKLNPNIINAIVDGKKVKYDLNKIDKWTIKGDPILNSVKIINDSLSKLNIKGDELLIRSTAINIFTEYYSNYKTNQKEIIILAIFYAIIINNNYVNILNILKIVDNKIQYSNIERLDEKFVQFFKEKYDNKIIGINKKDIIKKDISNLSINDQNKFLELKAKLNSKQIFVSNYSILKLIGITDAETYTDDKPKTQVKLKEEIKQIKKLRN